MYLDIIKTAFESSGIVLCIMLILTNVFFIKQYRTALSKFVPFVAGVLILYLLFTLLLTILIPNLHNKAIMFVFGILPFIIGKLVSYKTLNYYSIFQILCVILSVGFVILI